MGKGDDSADDNSPVRRAPAAAMGHTIYLGIPTVSGVVVTSEKRKVGGSTPPLPTAVAPTNDLSEPLAPTALAAS
jgi:hypothetical protein